MLKLKLFIVAAFVAFASCVFLFPNSKIEAQTSEKVQNRDEFYKKSLIIKIGNRFKSLKILNLNFLIF